MLRHSIAPRHDWQAKVEEYGLVWHSSSDQPYWNEDSYYSFTMSEIEQIEDATEECYNLFLEAGEYILNRGLLGKFGIPDYCHGAIKDAWLEESPALNYGRFDFGFDGVNPPKLFEFNCDTPTSLLEASVIQWNWKEEVHPHYDQFNSIHEALIARWAAIKPFLNSNLVHFTHAEEESGEDMINVSYMRDLAGEAGLITEGIMIQDIGWDGTKFVDLETMPITVLQHLYPWEWLMNEEFGRNIINTLDQTQWIEPIWKMMWSNKAVLPILWEMFPGHKNLLAAVYEGPPFLEGYVRKPILAREGANIEIVDRGSTTAKSEGAYNEDNCIYQELYRLPNFAGRYPVIGSWIVDGQPCGMGIREDGLITSNTAKFIPHIIV